MTFDVILPFLQPIASLIQDPEVSEIMVNGSTNVFIEREGRVEEVPGVHVDEWSLVVAVKHIARQLGDDVSEDQPLLDARLPDGSRVAAVLPPCSVGGTTLTIRKFLARYLTADELVRVGTLTADLLALLREAMAQRQTILISGGTSTGKTTLLNALAAFLPADSRVIVIEDTTELRLACRNLRRFEAKRAQPDRPAVTIRELVRASLRHRPDRILVGEVRGAEAFDLLQALNTGHAGSLSTIHANSAEQALNRFAACISESGVPLPYDAVRAQIADAVNLVLHLGRRQDRRVVERLIRIVRYDVRHDVFERVVLFDQAGAERAVAAAGDPRGADVAPATSAAPDPCGTTSAPAAPGAPDPRGGTPESTCPAAPTPGARPPESQVLPCE